MLIIRTGSNYFFEELRYDKKMLRLMVYENQWRTYKVHCTFKDTQLAKDLLAKFPNEFRKVELEIK